MKRAWVVVTILVIVLGGVGGLIVLAQVAKQRGAAAKVRDDAVERGALIATVSAPGRVEATASVNVSAEVPGRIIELGVEEGDAVERGDLLLRLDDARYRSQLQQAEAAARTARANLRLSQARLEKADADLDRLERLAAGDLASAEALENGRTEQRVLAAESDARREDVARAEAALAGARDDLEKTVYRAPLAGIVSRLNVEEGENVVVGTMNNPGTVILTIADMSGMQVEAEVDETDVVDVAPGQTAEISVDAVPDTTFAGTVATVGNSGRARAGASTEQAVDFEVIVRFDRPDPRLRPGMTADVDIQTDRREGVLTIPIQALVARSRSVLRKELEAAGQGAGRYTPPDSLRGDDRDRWDREIVEGVYRIEDGRARFVELHSGIADASRIEVAPAAGALEPGDRVVSGPFKVLRELKEGTRIKIRSGGDDEES